MTRKLLVQKYGGTSVGTPERIKSVAQRIRAARAAGHDLVVVVSAMGDATDELIELAHKVSNDPPAREMDMLLTAGERVSMALLSMALADLEIPALSFTGSQSGIITDGSHRRARIKRILGDRIREALAANKVAIVAGFQGVSEAKEVTTLGRGGSDTTAVALACALKAERCEIYTDVDGVFSADPRKVPSARHWPEIPAELMLEMAQRGAGVLHPRCVELALSSGVDVWVGNSLKAESPGTRVFGAAKIAELHASEGRAWMERFLITGVTCDESLGFFRVTAKDVASIQRIFAGAGDRHLTIVGDSLSVEGGGCTVAGFVPTDAAGEWTKLCETQPGAEGRTDEALVPVSVVGYRLGGDAGVLSEILATLDAARIPVVSVARGALAITFGVARKDAPRALEVLHERFLRAP